MSARMEKVREALNELAECGQNNVAIVVAIVEALAEVEEWEAILDARESSQIPMVPRAAQEELDRYRDALEAAAKAHFDWDLKSNPQTVLDEILGPYREGDPS